MLELRNQCRTRSVMKKTINLGPVSRTSMSQHLDLGHRETDLYNAASNMVFNYSALVVYTIFVNVTNG